MSKEIAAGIIIYRKIKDGIKFLILYHGRNYWNFPKGKLEFEPRIEGGALTQNKEKSWEAAVREIREETGLRLNDLKFQRGFRVYERFVFWRKAGDRKIKIFKVVIFYLAETRKSQISVSEEHEGYGWFTYREAIRILSKHKDSQRVLMQAHRFLRNPNSKIQY